MKRSLCPLKQTDIPEIPVNERNFAFIARVLYYEWRDSTIPHGVLMTRAIISLCSLFLWITIHFPASAQESLFGKNKVQYKEFDWFFLQTNHFDIYFTNGGDYIAQFTANAAESAYTSISKSFRYQISQRVPIMVYNSHNDFQQTNIVSQYMEEGIGGVTELFKNRVVVPFEGDYKKFRHVIHHELVHAVINDMFYGGSIQSIISNNITLQLPLWFNEGLSEYEALTWDTNSDMFMRDATIHEYLPSINQLYGYFAYRGGQSVWYYIAAKYGEQKISEILNRIKGSRSVELGFRSAIGLSVEELSERWQKEQKVMYWPDIAKRKEPSDYARKLTDHTKDGSFYNTSPTISPQGDKIAFISNRDDYFDVFIMDAVEGKILEKAVKGQRTPDFEELHLLTPGMSWSPDGKAIALAAKSGREDAIFIIDIGTGDEEKLEFGLEGIFEVDWSADTRDSGKGRGILAFIGMRDSKSDLFTYDLDSGVLTNLTDDIFSDSDPSWSADGRSIYFSSDRRDNIVPRLVSTRFKMHNHDFRQLDIYQLDIATQKITRLTDLPMSDETSPVCTSDGKHLLFISDMNGINNIYVHQLDSNKTFPLTNSLSGVYQLSLSRDVSKLAFSSLHKAGFDMFLMRNPLDGISDTSALEPTEYFRRLTMREDTTGKAAPREMEYQLREHVTIRLKESDSTRTSGEGQSTDYTKFVFKNLRQEKTGRKPDTTQITAITDNLDEEGNYKVNNYKLNFSPDIIYGNAGYNTFWGVQGSTIMAFSDMLGDHQIFVFLDMIIDLKNSDYAFAYLYLPKRIDYGIQGFHSVRFLNIEDVYGNIFYYRFRNYGATLMTLYPINRFKRLEFNLSWYNISRDNLSTAAEASQNRTLFFPTLSYVHDNSLWGLIAPATGERYNLSAIGSPKLSDKGLSFYTLTADYRRYYKLGKNYTLALRLAGGGSFGKDPQRFVIGGVDNWINRRFENDRIPIENAEDFVFLTMGVPLRGYDFGERMGTKYGLFNTELRFPLFGYFAAGPLPVFLQSFGGVFFFDMAGAWTHRKDFKAFAKDTAGETYMRDLLAGTGYGVRMILLGFLLKMDVAWAFDLRGFSLPHYYFSLGADI